MHLPGFAPRLAAGLVLALASMTAAQDAAPSSPDEAPNIVIPQRGVSPRPIHRADSPPTLTGVAVKVDLTEQVAATELRMTLRNDGNRVQEAQVLAPVPDGCVVRSFELEGLGEQGIARILPREEARRIYDEIVRQTRDPGLLEFAGYNLIRSSVFPVPAHGEQKVRLVYEQVLGADAGRVDYILPRSDSLERSGIEWSYEVDIRAKRPVSTVYSPSHDITTERLSPDHVKVKVTAQSAARDPGALRLSYLFDRTGGDGLAASLLAYPDATVADGQGGYFLMLAGLPADAQERKKVSREVIVVIDRSGSMRGQKMDQAREAARQVIEGLSDGEAFNIIDYSDAVASFADKPVIKNAETMAQARKYLDGITAQGGTNIHDALIEALRQEPTEGALPMVLFLTDGLPTVGERSEVGIREAAKKANIHKRRIFTFGVGYDVNSPLLSTLAGASRGTSTFVLPEEDVEVKVGQVFRRLSGPVLASPTLTILDKDGNKTTRQVRDLMPAELPDLFEGDQLTLLGQYAADEPIRVRLQGDYFGKPRTFEFTFNVDKASTRNASVPRLWAGRKIAFMIDEIRQAAAETSSAGGDARTKELVDEIVRLSTRWGILTEYTAFLATETTVAGVSITHQPAEAGQFRLRATESISDRAAAPGARGGRGAVNQEQNLGLMKQSEKQNARNLYLDSDMKQVETTAIRQIADQTVYKRGDRWVDANMLDKETDQPDQTVEFGSDEFRAVLDKLSAANRQGILALGGEIYILLDGQKILVKAPEAR
jgi:Ca-activated chloride channel family protein